MADFRKILTALLDGESYTQISRQHRCSRRDIANARKVIDAQALTASSIAELTDADIAALFPDGRSTISQKFHQPDFAAVVDRCKHAKHFTLLEAWRIYTATPSSAPSKYSYSQFCARFSDYLDHHDLTAVLAHTPGRAMHVDWAGDTVPIIDVVTDTSQPAYVFIAVLPYSGMIYANAYLDMKLDAWIQAHIDALNYFGGVPAMIIPDNAATATYRPSAKDPSRKIIERYHDFADFYTTAIVPARVRSPRDKAAVENAVRVVYHRVYSALADEVITSLSQLRDLISQRVEEINADIRRADDTTRWERFIAEEREELRPLPVGEFTTVEYKQLKVHRNYHITCQYQYYSVPHELAGQRLRVRLTPSTVTIFDHDTIVAEHRRLDGRKGQYSTVAAHAPEGHRHLDNLWDRGYFTDRARSFGPATTEIIGRILDSHAIEAQGYLTCQNILSTLGKKSRTGLEQACRHILDTGLAPTYSTVKKIQAALLTNATATNEAAIQATSGPQTAKPHPRGTGPETFLRGAGAYKSAGGGQ